MYLISPVFLKSSTPKPFPQYEYKNHLLISLDRHSGYSLDDTFTRKTIRRSRV